MNVDSNRLWRGFLATVLRIFAANQIQTMYTITEKWDGYMFAFRCPQKSGEYEYLINLVQEFKILLGDWLDFNTGVDDSIGLSHYNYDLFKEHEVLVIDEEADLSSQRETISVMTSYAFLKIKDLKFGDVAVANDSKNHKLESQLDSTDIHQGDDYFSITKCLYPPRDASITLYIEPFAHASVIIVFSVHHSIWKIDSCKELILLSFKALKASGWEIYPPDSFDEWVSEIT